MPRGPLPKTGSKPPRFGLRFTQGSAATASPPAALLTSDELEENYRFRLGDSEHGKNDHVELVDRVRRGVKPMATMLLRCGKHIHLSPKTLKNAVDSMGLAFQIVHTKGSRVEAVVYQKGLTLRHFYCPSDILARYKGAGVQLREDLFDTPLEELAFSLAKEDFTPAPIKYPLMGMCFGYPVCRTLELLRCL